MGSSTRSLQIAPHGIDGDSVERQRVVVGVVTDVVGVDVDATIVVVAGKVVVGPTVGSVDPAAPATNSVTLLTDPSKVPDSGDCSITAPAGRDDDSVYTIEYAMPSEDNSATARSTVRPTRLGRTVEMPMVVEVGTSAGNVVIAETVAAVMIGTIVGEVMVVTDAQQAPGSVA